ncbi:hypothetical protein BgiBS90_023591 [Biomphalaria glabrata]|nr:hypothetical protein BgiBS90_023591 [Biomphalaria glabrata]
MAIAKGAELVIQARSYDSHIGDYAVLVFAITLVFLLDVYYEKPSPGNPSSKWKKRLTHEMRGEEFWVQLPGSCAEVEKDGETLAQNRYAWRKLNGGRGPKVVRDQSL